MIAAHGVELPAETAAASAFLISIVVPVLNEESLVRQFLIHLRLRAPGAEVIVVDGGSTDGTREVAGPLCDQLVISKPGRARQLNDGARAAHGNVLWFLHADSELPAGCLAEIHHALADRKMAGGYFRIRLPDTHAIYRLTDSFAHYAGILLRIRCGDHGFFCRRSMFFQSGGFPEVPLMEDVEFYRTMHHFGGVTAVGKRIRTSVRRYEQSGRIRVTLAYGLIALLYALRVPIRVLAKIYARTCARSSVRCPGQSDSLAESPSVR